MKKVSAFETSDSKVFTNELDAIKHEQLLELRDLIVTHFGSNQATPQLPSAFAAMLTTKGDKVNEIVQRYKRKILGYQKRNQSPTSIPISV